MKIDRWIAAEQACETLAVKKQTLYAYVSRGLIETTADERDPRRRLYSALDVEELATRNRMPRARAAVASEAIAWGEPVLESAISTVRGGQLFFADRPAVECAKNYSLEEICDHHFGVEGNAVPKLKTSVPREATAVARAYEFLSRRAACGSYSSGRTINALALEARELLPGFADAMIGRAFPGLVHERLALHWSLDSRAEGVLRAALVLMSDHELNASTFAVRVCASTGASLPACVLAGFATLSGPRHGEASTRAYAFLSDALTQSDTAAVVARHSRAGGTLPGFGHPLYPAGDPRAGHILSTLPRRSAIRRRIEKTSALVGHLPNSDAALAAFALAHELPEDAPFMMFAIARVSGWLAHAAEQALSNQLIRPRARFVARSAPAQ